MTGRQASNRQRQDGGCTERDGNEWRRSKEGSLLGRREQMKGGQPEEGVQGLEEAAACARRRGNVYCRVSPSRLSACVHRLRPSRSIAPQTARGGTHRTAPHRRAPHLEATTGLLQERGCSARGGRH